MEIPLISGFERLHACGDRMLGQLVELRIPMGIHRPIRFKIPTEPLEKFGPATLLGNLDCIMDTDEPRSPFHLLLKPRQVRQRGMSAPTIGVDHNGVGLIEQPVVFRPTVSQDGTADIGIRVLDHLRENLGTCKMLVRAVVMALTAGDEDHMLLAVLSIAC